MKGWSLLLLIFVMLGCENGEDSSDQDQNKKDTIKETPEPKTIKEQNEANDNKLNEIMDVETPKIKTKNDSLYQEIMSAQPKSR